LAAINAPTEIKHGGTSICPDKTFMKFILLIILSTIPVWALENEFNQMENYNGHYGMFKLTHSKDDSHYAILDCQSYFQKMDFKDSQGETMAENFITMDECEEIYSNIKWCFQQNKNKCFDSDAVLIQSCECL
jgi:hypothetical protein